MWNGELWAGFTRIDPATREVQEVAPVPGSPVALALDGHTVWVLDSDGSLIRVDLTG